ncbi:hypothetical protein JW964_09210, partial [candidate division KSB1 bacterium]|nr:hypothetical protein [candidate division KSB1 bacterium]
MKRLILLIWFGVILSLCTITFSSDLQKTRLLEQLRTRPEIFQNKAQLQSVFQELSRIQLAPHEIRELEQLLKQKLPAGFEKYWEKLNHLPGQIEPFRLNHSNPTIPFSKYNNQAPTLAEQKAVNPVMEDFQVNENVGRCDHSDPQIAMNSNGNYVVVWYDYRNVDPDIFAQRYNSSGVKQGNSFRVNDDSGSSDQYSPAIAVDGSGNFVVVWEDYRNGNRRDIYGQRYSSSGAKQGTNFLVNYNSGSLGQYSPAIAVDGSGNFVVVWEDDRNGNSDIYGQRYSSSGAKQDTNFLINDVSGSIYQGRPEIVVDGSGNFVVVWSDGRNGNPDIYGQWYNSSGAKQGTNFLVNDDSGSSDQYSPAIAVDGSGNFVVVWYDERNGNYDIYGQRYGSSGAKQDANFLVNDDSGSSYQSGPEIVVDGNGIFVVVWLDERNGNYDIYGQRYSSSGAKQGTNFLVNDDSGSSWQIVPKIAVDGSGNFVVVWNDYRNGNRDIYGQRYSSSGTKQGNNFLINDDG